MRCMSGALATGGCPPPTTGRAPRPPTRRRGARATGPRRRAVSECRHGPLRNQGCSPRGSIPARRESPDASDMRSQAKKGAACRRRYLQSENAAVGVRFDVDAVILDGTAHTAALPAAPIDAPARCDAAGRRRNALGAVLSARIWLRPGVRDGSQLQGRACRESVGPVAASTRRRVATPPASVELASSREATRERFAGPALTSATGTTHH